MEYQINLKDIKERIFKNENGWSNYRRVSIEEMDWLVEQAEKTKQLEKYIEVKDQSLKEIRKISSGLSFTINQLSINALKINGEE